MNESGNGIFDELELDALGELMNVSFGSAAAGLAEILDIFIHLNIPSINLIKKSELATYIKRQIPECRDCSMIEQKYCGDFGGSAILLFPYGIEKELLSFFTNAGPSNYEPPGIAGLESEVLMEIGNILIGACTGRIFELLNSKIVYYPPTAVLGKNLEDLIHNDFSEPDEICIILKTRFSFERS